MRKFSLNLIAVSALCFFAACSTDEPVELPQIPDDMTVAFPDPIFREYVIEHCDIDHDRKISAKEAAKVKSISCSNRKNEETISLEGIQYFVNLTYLHCSDYKLSNLDLSKNTKLETIYFYDNQLTSLDLSKNTKLTNLECYDNQLTSLDLSKNTNLTHLNCTNNQLTRLDLSKNTKLEALYCYDNQLTSLDLSKNTKLTNLECNDNQLTSLDLSKNTKLYYLWCNDNQLTSLDFSNNKLDFLRCENNPLEVIYVKTGQDLRFIPDEYISLIQYVD